MQLKRLGDVEGDKKNMKKKNLALKVTNVKNMESEDKDCCESDEDMTFMFR